MQTVRIMTWDGKDYFDAGERPNTTLLFDKTFDDQEFVRSLYEQFSLLRRGGHATHGPLIPRHAYRFSFSTDGSPDQVYDGTSHSPLWKVYTDPSDKTSVRGPEHILISLHDSIGLPFELPLGHR